MYLFFGWVPYLPSDPHLTGPTSICIGKPADQQDRPKNQQIILIVNHTYLQGQNELFLQVLSYY